MIVHTLNGAETELIPILVKVQLLQTRLLNEPDAFATAWNWIDAFVRLQHSEPTYRMLRQAMASRRALLLLDGLDEGGEKREQIERHVTEVLAPQGHVLLATSRPDGIDDQRYASFRRLELKPLSVDQQKQALEQRLGTERASPLLPYLERMPVDEQTQERITANPLMLSMVASIFELRSGLEMPESVVDLYTQATGAMLGRAGGGSAGELTPLLQAFFFEAQSSETRVITERHLRAAALRVEDGESSLKRFKELALAERMPLLSLLQTRPLQLQSTHLSIQEFYAARAVCEGARLPKQPWELSAFWANTVRLGLDMGTEFGHGLLSSSGKALAGSSVRVTIRGDRRTSALALGAALRAAEHVMEAHVSLSAKGEGRLPVVQIPLKTLRNQTSVDLSKSELHEDHVMVVSGFARRAVEPPIKLQALVLAQTCISPAVVTALAPIITRLEIVGAIDDQKMSNLGDALLSCSNGRLGSLKCSIFDLPEDATTCDLARKEIKKPGAATLLAGVLKFNTLLTHLEYAAHPLSAHSSCVSTLALSPSLCFCRPPCQCPLTLLLPLAA